MVHIVGGFEIDALFQNWKIPQLIICPKTQKDNNLWSLDSKKECLNSFFTRPSKIQGVLLKSLDIFQAYICLVWQVNKYVYHPTSSFFS